jgi:hypothetical protein
VRDVREEERAKRAVDHAADCWPRANDAWEAITWVVAHDPAAGTPETESGNIRSLVLDGARSIGLPTVTIIYEVTEHVILVHDAIFEDAKHTQAGRA